MTRGDEVLDALRVLGHAYRYLESIPDNERTLGVAQAQVVITERFRRVLNSHTFGFMPWHFVEWK